VPVHCQPAEEGARGPETGLRGREGDKMSKLIEIVTELVAELRDWLFSENYGE
jgi:hypothetical protein